jgi:pyrroline-5-carboxylate reductase
VTLDRFWLVGCGAMAGAMLARWVDSGQDPGRFTVIDPGQPNVPAGVRCLTAFPHEDAPGWLMLGVKPQMLPDVAAAVQLHVGPETTLLSILAGIKWQTLRDLFPGARHVVRVMPNLPVRVGQGVVGLHGTDERGPVDALMAPLGLVEWIDDEALFDAVTALSGSGPAFVYRYAQALAEGGVALGLAPDVADRLARATVAGAATLAKASPEPLATLADRVASKGGSTREGLNVLDDGDALTALVAKALRAAENRNRELAKPAG